MNRKILYIIGSLMITFSLSACDYFGDDDSDGPASGYLSIEAWDLTPSQKLIVWVYPDDTAFTMAVSYLPISKALSAMRLDAFMTVIFAS